MKDKTAKLLEVIDHPELLEDSELKEILDDPETAEIYKTMSRTADALAETKEPDIDEEWKSFSVRNFPDRHRNGSGFIVWFFSRKVAVVSVIAFAALSIVAAGITYHIPFRKKIGRFLMKKR